MADEIPLVIEARFFLGHALKQRAPATSEALLDNNMKLSLHEARAVTQLAMLLEEIDRQSEAPVEYIPTVQEV